MRLSAFGALIILVASCAGGRGSSADCESESFDWPDTLRVATLYGPMSYFEYRGDTMGYDYALMRQLADDKGLAVDFTITPTLAEAVALLDSGIVDAIAYDVPVTAEYLEKVVPCAYEHIATQVLVQKKGPEALTDVTQLVGKDVFVEKDSKYYYRLTNLDEELGGGINICTIEDDSLMSVDWLQMISDGELPLTVVDSEIAKLNKAYYPDLDITLEVSFPQRSAWAVSNKKTWLADSINRWYESESPQNANKLLLRRYFELSRRPVYDVRNFGRSFKNGYISPYDDLFKKYGAQEGVDWRLLAAIGYAESKFRPEVVSWAGARGIMQIMPSVARGRGVDVSMLEDPATSIRLASQMLAKLDRSLSDDVPDASERQKFVMAAYNSGLAHILDAIGIAKAVGLDPMKWDGNVADALRMKSLPEIYNDKSICKYGYFKGTYTISYVNNVTNLYRKAVSAFPKEPTPKGSSIKL